MPLRSAPFGPARAAATALVVALAAGPTRAERPVAPTQLNLILHGVAAFVIWPDHLEVLVPDVHDHVYKAGTWGKELRLKQGATYSLTGVRSAASPPPIDPRSNLVLRSVTQIDRSPEKVFCSFSLPLPSQMVGLRSARSTERRPFFSGASTAGLAVHALPLVHTLVYSINDIGQLRLGGSMWVPEPDKDGIVNLHVWAEPDVDLGEIAPTHRSLAFDTLMTLFPELRLKLEFGPAVAPDRVVRVKGLNAWEQWTLVERSRLLYPGDRQKRKGSEVSNCIALIVDNTTLLASRPQP